MPDSPITHHASSGDAVRADVYRADALPVDAVASMPCPGLRSPGGLMAAERVRRPKSPGRAFCSRR